jgi:two-component system chemotaxis response regulator CheY
MPLHTHYAVKGRLGRILIADDEAAVRKPIGLCLTKAGYEVVEAEDGAEAINAMGTDDNSLMVDTILCDIRMPKINGTEAIAYFRAQHPSVPIVVMTGHPDAELAVSLMKDGVVDYLVKPVPKEDLLAVMRKSVDRHVVCDAGFAG